MDASNQSSNNGDQSKEQICSGYSIRNSWLKKKGRLGEFIQVSKVSGQVVENSQSEGEIIGETGLVIHSVLYLCC